MKDPTTTTDASQMELMDQIKKHMTVLQERVHMSGTRSKDIESKEPKQAEPSKALSRINTDNRRK